MKSNNCLTDTDLSCQTAAQGHFALPLPIRLLLRVHRVTATTASSELKHDGAGELVVGLATALGRLEDVDAVPGPSGLGWEGAG